MTTVSVANITSVCLNQENLGFVSAPLKRNLFYGYALDNNLSVEKNKTRSLSRWRLVSFIVTFLWYPAWNYLIND